MPAGLPAPPDDPENHVQASSPPFAVYIARDVWDEALRGSGDLVVSMGEYGRFRLRIEQTDATGPRILADH
ncbi:MAG: hypothetical protein MUE60_12420 [Candidatus Eisenbacteria bacterium]|nr:hypothetical protein [Candidatus Eisenbacteria bacterium]